MDCVDGISVCMYVCMYGGHSVLRSNSKLHDNFGKMETHARPRMPCIILVNHADVVITVVVLTIMLACKSFIFMGVLNPTPNWYLRFSGAVLGISGCWHCTLMLLTIVPSCRYDMVLAVAVMFETLPGIGRVMSKLQVVYMGLLLVRCTRSCVCK